MQSARFARVASHKISTPLVQKPPHPAPNLLQIKFQLDWRFEGPPRCSWPAAKGYFKAAKLDVTIDAGNGSGGTVTRVASGTYDMGFADLAALMEFHANNPDAPNKPVAVMMVYNNTPAAVLALKKSGIKTPADLNGKKLGAPVFDAGRRAFPIFAKANGISNACSGPAMDPPLRETMLAKRRRRRHHRLLVHLAAEPGSARREGRGRRRAALPAATASSCTAT
jgi:NitT/TauT family transport system substrate-binding protein